MTRPESEGSDSPVLGPHAFRLGHPGSDPECELTSPMTYLHFQEADIALTALRITNARASVADYTSFYEFEGVYLVFKTSETSSSKGSSDFYLRPFQWEVYVVIGGCMAYVLLLLLLTRCSVSYIQEQGPQRIRPGVMHWLMADTEAMVASLLSRCKLNLYHFEA